MLFFTSKSLIAATCIMLATMLATIPGTTNGAPVTKKVVTKKVVVVKNPAPAPASTTTTTKPTSSADGSIKMSLEDMNKMLCLLNNFRAQNGKPPVALHPDIAKSAGSHSTYMKSLGKLSHDDPNGKLQQRIERFGFKGVGYAAENIFEGSSSVDVAMDSWKKSPDHKKNMLSGDVVFVGFGLDGEYFTQQFAAPMDKKGYPAKGSFQTCPKGGVKFSVKTEAGVSISF
ncbi:hypothetical protein H4219_006369 [Mycoemilia scoparia]|uniref:SCP domain-containing protein n=1 Tax=Mycoemilia scoparia TaxID=417184 RepID=A0A9W7ZPU1_9FUNG|nr:hypothetical protein H4219_006369 [Mycoemilia scoparia]